MAELQIIAGATLKVLVEFGPIVLLALGVERVTRRGA